MTQELDGDMDESSTPKSGQDDRELTLEEKLQRLDAIVGSLEAEDLELDRALELFEEGVKHIREAEELLAKAELQVEELVGEGDNAHTREFDEGTSPEGSA